MMNEQNQNDESSKDDINNVWKKSPEEAHFSDWSIEVKHDEYIDGTKVVPAKTATYSVHRVFLATETGSAHFMKLFTGPFLESRKNHSIYDLPVPDISFHHWETFLNYCYSVGLKFNPENAVPMYYFGDYFGVDQLKNRAYKYLLGSMKKSKSGVLSKYLDSARRLHMDTIQNEVARICVQRPHVKAKHTTSWIPDNELWRSVCNPTNSYVTNLSEQKNRSAIDAEMFRVLADPNALPFISPSAAILLMEQEQDICQNVPDLNTLTNIQNRCIKSLYDNKHHKWLLSENDFERLNKLPTVVSVSLLQKSITDFNTKSPKLVSIEVAGAGINTVNGTYVRSGSSEDAFFFSRSRSAGVFGESEKQVVIRKQQDCFYISSFDRNEFNSAAVSTNSPHHNYYATSMTPPSVSNPLVHSVADWVGWTTASSEFGRPSHVFGVGGYSNAFGLQPAAFGGHSAVPTVTCNFAN